MLADQDHPLEDAIAEADSGATPDPKVVVVYRTRGVPLLLIPPLLLIAAVSAIVVYRRSDRSEPQPFLLARQMPPSASPAVTGAVHEIPRRAVGGPSRVDAFSELAEATGRPAPAAPSTTEGPRYDPTLDAPKPPEPAAAPVEPPSRPAPTASGPVRVGEDAPSVAHGPAAPEPRPAQAEAKPTMPEPFDPIVVVGQKAQPTPATADDPPLPLPTPPSEPVRRDRVGFDPEAARAALDAEAKPMPDQPAADRPEAQPPAEAPPEPPLALDPPRAQRAKRTREAEVDIQAEAERKLAQRIQLEAMKPGLLNPDPLEILRSRDELKAGARRLAAKDRPVFHGEMSQLIREYGRGAGPDIKTLRDRFGVDSIPEIVIPANRDLTGVAERLTTTERIRRMRLWGLPETMILDDLYEQERHNIKSRGGPRNEDEAWVFAARVLLRHPPPIPRSSPPPTEAAPAGR